MTFTAAQVDRGPSRADDQLVDQVEQISGVAGIITNSVDPPLCDLVPGLVRSQTGRSIRDRTRLIDLDAHLRTIRDPLRTPPLSGAGAVAAR